MKTHLLLMTCTALLVGACDKKDWEAAGYQDGYAATINTACGFRATMVHGEFDNGDYAKGYSRGAQAGALAIAQQGCERLRQYGIATPSPRLLPDGENRFTFTGWRGTR